MSDQGDQLRQGIIEFNERSFFQCHETLEHLWRGFNGPERELIQGIIQIAVGYYHHLNGNNVGALKLLRRGMERVEKFPNGSLGVETKILAAAVAQDIQRLSDSSIIEPLPLIVPMIELTAN